MEPIITFKSYKIKNIDYKFTGLEKESDSSKENEDTINTRVHIGISKDLKEGLVLLKNEINDMKNERTITVELYGEFDILKEMNEDEIKDILRVNGVAMLYPYARSLVSILTSIDSESAILLPTINTSISS